MSWFTKIRDDIDYWFGEEESNVAAFLKPIIDDVVATGKTEILTDIADGLPTVAAALVSGGASAAMTAAEGIVKTTVESQAVTLATTTVTSLAASLAAQAQAAASAIPTPATTPPS
jgi:hypothetical protein